MSSITQVLPSDHYLLERVDALLLQEGIERDKNLDYICAILDDDYNVIATGSCFHCSLRCFAVDHLHQGEGLMNELVTHLINVQATRGNFHLFVYTKPDTAKFFEDLGFYEIARVPGALVFLENRSHGFESYLDKLKSESPNTPSSASVVMNANPFTLGHQYLVETAAASSNLLHLFIVSEDASLIPYSVRKQLILEGTAHIKNICYHDCGPYMISSATFPSYFLKDETKVIQGQAHLDISIFTKVAEALSISSRFVGDEPLSHVTSLYNEVMSHDLPAAGIACHIIPRKTINGEVISASNARLALQKNDMKAFASLVPKATYDWFTSPAAAPVLEKIRSAGNVVHY